MVTKPLYVAPVKLKKQRQIYLANQHMQRIARMSAIPSRIINQPVRSSGTSVSAIPPAQNQAPPAASLNGVPHDKQARRVNTFQQEGAESHCPGVQHGVYWNRRSLSF